MTKEKNTSSELIELIQYDADNFLKRKLTEEELDKVLEDCCENLIWIIQKSLTEVEEKRKSKKKLKNEKNINNTI